MGIQSLSNLTIEPLWMRLAHRGHIRLRQSAADVGGGSDDAVDDTDTSDADATEEDDASDADTEVSEEQKLETVEDYKVALDKAHSDNEAVARVRRNLDRRTKKDQKTIEDLRARLEGKGGDDSGDGEPVDADALRAEIRAEVAHDNGLKLATAKAEALLTGKVNIKPSRAAMLMADAIKDAVGDDGEVDEHALNDAIEELLEEDPGLKLARGESRFQGDADQGAREVRRQSEEQQLEEQLKKAEKSLDFPSSIAIKQRLAAIRAAKKKG